jgi:outer membrane immunogenic protein
MRHFIALLGAATLGISVANAADMPVKAPAMVASAYNWSGLYIGLNGGYGWGRESWIDNTGAPSVSLSPKGGVFGGQIGYRWQWNQLVLGVEGTWDWASVKDNVAATAIFSEEVKVKSIYTLTGQAGWAFDRWLPYVKGGWAGAQTDFNFFNPTPSGSTSITVNGWTVGGGIDYAVWQNLIVGVEYDHFSFNYPNFNLVTTAGLLTITNASRLTVDQVVVRASYKFWTP